jgi:hypothetical protein
MATSPNFNWPEPDNTDLVKNGALAIRTAVNAIDTSLVDLKGGTTGQVLAKATNTDMDFSWVAQDDSNAIQNSIVDAKGDLIAATANDTPARLAVGTDAFFLQAASGQATGLQWGGSYTSYTPTLASITLGNGTLAGSYLQIGKFVHVVISLTLGTTSAIGTFPRFSLPLTASAQNVAQVGAATYTDTGVQSYWGTVNLESTTQVQAYLQDTTGNYSQRAFVSTNAPFTWGSTDTMDLNFYYKVA